MTNFGGDLQGSINASGVHVKMESGSISAQKGGDMSMAAQNVTMASEV